MNQETVDIKKYISLCGLKIALKWHCIHMKKPILGPVETLNQTTAIPPSEVSQDIVFLVESTGPSAENLQSAVAFIRDFVSNVTLGPEHSQVCPHLLQYIYIFLK